MLYLRYLPIIVIASMGFAMFAVGLISDILKKYR